LLQASAIAAKEIGKVFPKAPLDIVVNPSKNKYLGCILKTNINKRVNNENESEKRILLLLP
jgi:hypothetical protein